MRNLLMISVAIGATILSQPAAAQQNLTCGELHSQLSKASTTQKSVKSLKRYDKAIAKQTQMRAKVTTDLERFRCTSSRNAACKKLTSTLRKMDNNLGKLKKKRDAIMASNSRNSASAIKAKMDAQNCSRNIIKISTKPTTSKIAEGIRISGKTPKPPAKRTKAPSPAINSNSKVVALRSRNNYGSYKTMCVRSCDGFYFPISSNTSSSSFERDEFACSLMCPGTETNLYYHNSRNQESEDMISYRTSEPYKEEPFAFKYRTDFSASDASCTCNLTAFHQEMSRREALLIGKSASSVQIAKPIQSIIPITKIDPGEDPETALNIQGGLNDKDIDAMANASQLGEYTTSQSKTIRKVGPVFIQDDAGSNLLNSLN